MKTGMKREHVEERQAKGWQTKASKKGRKGKKVNHEGRTNN